MSREIDTGRGRYRISTSSDAASVLRQGKSATVIVDHSGGLERFGFEIEVAPELGSGFDSPEHLVDRIAAWIGADFERIREAALKSIRGEKRPLLLRFDALEPGPFKQG